MASRFAGGSLCGVPAVTMRRVTSMVGHGRAISASGRWKLTGCVLAIPLLPSPALRVQGAVKRPKADQLRLARDMSMMFDELKALADRHAALHSDRARLQAELDQARAELAMARRPWWRIWGK